MGAVSGGRCVGLNRHGDEVFDVRGERILRRGGRDYYEADNQDQPAHLFLRIRKRDDLAWCAKGLCETITADPAFSHEALEQFFSDLFPADQPDRIAELVALTRQYMGLFKPPEANARFDALLAKPVAPAMIHEPDPVIFVGIEGVITSLKTRMFRRSFDPDAIGLIARLARKTGARLMLMSPMRRTWPAGAEALHQTLIAEGMAADLWHREWMLPAIDGGTTWQELDAWLAGRDCDALSALIIMQQGDCHPGELPDDVGYFDTFPADGFTQWNYFEILAKIGLTDGEVEPPPDRPASGFRVLPARWRGREIARPASAGSRSYAPGS